MHIQKHTPNVSKRPKIKFHSPSEGSTKSSTHHLSPFTPPFMIPKCHAQPPPAQQTPYLRRSTTWPSQSTPSPASSPPASPSTASSAKPPATSKAHLTSSPAQKPTTTPCKSRAKASKPSTKTSPSNSVYYHKRSRTSTTRLCVA